MNILGDDVDDDDNDKDESLQKAKSILPGSDVLCTSKLRTIIARGE